MRLCQAFKLLYLLVSTMLLLMSLTDPRSECLAGVELYSYIFVFCVLVYIPLMVAVFVFLARSLIVFFWWHNFWGGGVSLATAVIGGAALYCFDWWVFNYIF